MHFHMDIAVLTGVGVAPIIDDRRRGKPTPAVQDATRLASDTRRPLVRGVPFRDVVRVGIEPADPLVQIQEVRLRDLPGVERAEPILDAHVVESRPANPVSGSIPKILIMWSYTVARAPVGLLTGS